VELVLALVLALELLLPLPLPLPNPRLPTLMRSLDGMWSVDNVVVLLSSAHPPPFSLFSLTRRWKLLEKCSKLPRDTATVHHQRLSVLHAVMGTGLFALTGSSCDRFLAVQPNSHVAEFEFLSGDGDFDVHTRLDEAIISAVEKENCTS
jgi:hypothetical protein